MSTSGFVFDPDHFLWLRPLTSNWQVLQKYAVHLANNTNNNFGLWKQTGLYEGEWTVYGIINKTVGLNRFDPVLSPLLRKIPYEPFIAAFSQLSPGTVIKPHIGITDDVLRFHLGLICPEGAAIKIDSIEYTWKEGEWLIFNDRAEHSAWNYSNSSRIVLILDFYKKDLGVA
jgi:beta-hydroxylase